MRLWFIILKWAAKEVIFKLQWLQTGSLHYETLRKYIGESTDAAAKSLRSGLWNEVRTSLATGGLTIDAFVRTEISGDNSVISRAASSIAQVIENLRKLASRAV